MAFAALPAAAAVILPVKITRFQVMHAHDPGQKKKRVKARGRSAGGSLTLVDTRLAGVALAQRDFIFLSALDRGLRWP